MGVGVHGETVVTSKPEPEEQLDVAVNYLSMLAAALHFVAAAVAFAVLVVAVAANKTSTRRLVARLDRIDGVVGEGRGALSMRPGAKAGGASRRRARRGRATPAPRERDAAATSRGTPCRDPPRARRRRRRERRRTRDGTRERMMTSLSIRMIDSYGSRSLCILPVQNAIDSSRTALSATVSVSTRVAALDPRRSARKISTARATSSSASASSSRVRSSSVVRNRNRNDPDGDDPPDPPGSAPDLAPRFGEVGGPFAPREPSRRRARAAARDLPLHLLELLHERRAFRRRAAVSRGEQHVAVDVARASHLKRDAVRVVWPPASRGAGGGYFSAPRFSVYAGLSCLESVPGGVDMREQDCLCAHLLSDGSGSQQRHRDAVLLRGRVT